jgi:hypothetical protein
MRPYRIWRAEHAEALKAVPLDAIRIDAAWFEHGPSTIQVWVSNGFVTRFEEQSVEDPSELHNCTIFADAAAERHHRTTLHVRGYVEQLQLGA